MPIPTLVPNSVHITRTIASSKWAERVQFISSTFRLFGAMNVCALNRNSNFETSKLHFLVLSIRDAHKCRLVWKFYQQSSCSSFRIVWHFAAGGSSEMFLKRDVFIAVKCEIWSEERHCFCCPMNLTFVSLEACSISFCNCFFCVV